IIADAAAEGLIQRHQSAPAEGNVSAVEPLAEWEAELLQASENPQSTAERIEAVDGAVSGAGPDAAEKVAEVVAAQTPTEENDADAAVAEKADAAKAEKKTPAKKPAADKADKADKAEKPAADKAPAAKKPAADKPAAEK
ncbi:MAG: 30S ribosomal protein S2, partial [Rhodoglobus sp.]